MESIKNIEVTKTKSQSFWELVRFAIVALVIVIPVRIFVAEPFIVSGLSMFPTFNNGDYLIVDKLSYELGDIKRDDVVVFRYPNDTTKFFIKRIIGLPDETVSINNDTVTIYNKQNPNGELLTEPYANLSGSCPKTNINLKVTLTSSQYFVMGDNRECSSDSRYWGPVSKNLLVGRAFLRLLPVTKIDMLPGSSKPQL